MPDSSDRATYLGLLASAPAGRLADLLPDLPPHDLLRPPEIGTVMVRGRSGGTGAPFNLGEMTVTRASVRLPGGMVGHGYVQGRSRDHALRAAVVDALMQTDAADRIRTGVLTPLAAERQARNTTRAARAAATRVEFFTLVRGEDT
ncbi:MAG: phosphonate C-P lyase system protein PhnG [Paracoccus sp. (in: a-proteobacteria)]|nr:phosphonate C-P lyase system protein PhnG [Paracoccus sp. (in: a-proteobacteria)]